jgi:gliding motility-associated-like protein
MTIMESLMKFFLPVVCFLVFSRTNAQTQSCPLNSNFSAGSLTHWLAYTGNNRNGNGPGAIMQTYDSNAAAPAGTIGATTIDEYLLAGDPGIQVINTASKDPYGGFLTIPNINGYQYNNSVLLGSTTISHSNSGGTAGGYIRGISYRINVPTYPATQPYTMTYAYAMVLENGMHNSNQQPLFTATLSTNDSVISCASPKYFLPTSNNANSQGTGATLDTAIAEAEGFSLSSQLSPNPDPNSSLIDAPHLQDVWTKAWVEVTFDLSPYRGQQVVLTFEADNCVPGGHFSYAYVALRNTCDGLIITGPLQACIGKNLTYSVPSLGGGSYSWTIPPSWSVISGSNSNILNVSIPTTATGGMVTAHAINGCANLRDTIEVTATPPTIPGSVGNNNEVCAGNNANILTASGYRGSILSWLSSPDGVSWTPITDTTAQYEALNLTATTLFLALVQNGSSCNIDSSAPATILVDPKTVAGQLSPANMDVCTNQDKDAMLTLSGKVGNVLNWQSSPDNVNWNDFNPVNTAVTFSLIDLANSTDYRVIVKSGVCPSDTSNVSEVTVVPGLFPEGTIDPADTTICYGATAPLFASITLGTDYTWTNTGTLTNTGSGNITSTPYYINAAATPLSTTDYVLSIVNAGCPNPLIDTFLVNVIPPILVDAGNDTSVVIDQPLQLNASSNNSTTTFTWTPPTGLSNPDIPNPVAILGSGIDSVRYFVRATTPTGCYGTGEILVKIFSTAPDIFVPNAFTPGNTSNNIFRPIAVGISSLQFFRVYNRWGQLVYGTSALGQGWDGRVNGKIQDSGTYVWMVQGTSYVGKTVFQKGTVILVR